MKTTIKALFILTIACLGIISCSDNETETSDVIPVCIQEMIDNNGGKFVSVIEYEWNSKPYYYFLSNCCDMLDLLYDEDCNYVCAPSGAIHGGGDFLCPEFFDEACCEEILWEL